ncbi:MAG TPA: ABC transporter substrate-binding protein [Terriglobia bacterium]|nr:ABC transporter substrate-binding protein [Terriglobia bacterium]
MTNIQILAVLLCSAFLAFCGGHHTIESDTVTLAVEAGPTPSLDPRIGTSSEAERIDQLIFNSLVRRGPRFEILPDLAERWEVPQPTIYRFYLRRGVRFHDGRDLTAKDVQYTFSSLLEGSVVSAKTSTYRIIDRIETPDDYCVVFKLKEPYASFLWNLTNGAIGIVPHGAPPDCGRFPIGTGPFRFVSYSREDALVLEQNDAYFDSPPAVRQVIVRIVPDATTRALELRKGSIDIVQNALSPDFVEVLSREAHLTICISEGTNYAYMGFNLNDPILRDQRVRQAIAYALDREEIIKYYWRDFVTPASSILPPNHWAHEENTVKYSYQPAKARQLLDLAGWKDPDGDGPMPRFRLTYKTSTEESTRQVATIIQQELKNVGIQLDLRPFEFGTFYGDIVRGNFQLFTLRWIGGNNDPDILETVFHSDRIPPRGFNRGRYRNERIDQLIELARTELNQDRRKELYSEVQKILAVDLPYIDLWYFKNVCIYQKRISGLTLSPSGDYDFLKSIRLSP